MERFRGMDFRRGMSLLIRAAASRSISIPEHQHDTIETYTILQGSGEIAIGTEKQRLSSGYFCSHPPESETLTDKYGRSGTSYGVRLRT